MSTNKLIKTAKNTSNLVEFEANQTSYQRRCGSNGWNNLSSNLLGGVSISDVDAIVKSSQVRSGSDKIDVMVRIIVLLKFDRIKAVSSKGRRCWKRFNDLVHVRRAS